MCSHVSNTRMTVSFAKDTFQRERSAPILYTQFSPSSGCMPFLSLLFCSATPKSSFKSGLNHQEGQRVHSRRRAPSEGSAKSPRWFLLLFCYFSFVGRPFRYSTLGHFLIQMPPLRLTWPYMVLSCALLIQTAVLTRSFTRSQLQVSKSTLSICLASFVVACFEMGQRVMSLL